MKAKLGKIWVEYESYKISGFPICSIHVQEPEWDQERFCWDSKRGEVLEDACLKGIAKFFGVGIPKNKYLLTEIDLVTGKVVIWEAIL